MQTKDYQARTKSKYTSAKSKYAQQNKALGATIRLEAKEFERKHAAPAPREPHETKESVAFRSGLIVSVVFKALAQSKYQKRYSIHGMVLWGASGSAGDVRKRFRLCEWYLTRLQVLWEVF